MSIFKWDMGTHLYIQYSVYKKLVLNWIQLCVIVVWELMPEKITKETYEI